MTTGGLQFGHRRAIGLTLLALLLFASLADFAEASQDLKVKGRKARTRLNLSNKKLKGKSRRGIEEERKLGLKRCAGQDAADLITAHLHQMFMDTYCEYRVSNVTRATLYFHEMSKTPLVGPLYKRSIKTATGSDYGFHALLLLHVHKEGRDHLVRVEKYDELELHDGGASVEDFERNLKTERGSANLFSIFTVQFLDTAEDQVTLFAFLANGVTQLVGNIQQKATEIGRAATATNQEAIKGYGVFVNNCQLFATSMLQGNVRHMRRRTTEFTQTSEFLKNVKITIENAPSFVKPAHEGEPPSPRRASTTFNEDEKTQMSAFISTLQHDLNEQEPNTWLQSILNRLSQWQSVKSITSRATTAASSSSVTPVAEGETCPLVAWSPSAETEAAAMIAMIHGDFYFFAK